MCAFHCLLAFHWPFAAVLKHTAVCSTPPGMGGQILGGLVIEVRWCFLCSALLPHSSVSRGRFPLVRQLLDCLQQRCPCRVGACGRRPSQTGRSATTSDRRRRRTAAAHVVCRFPYHGPQCSTQRTYPGRGASIGRLLALVIWIENMSHMSKSIK